jgi:hypothetical protein
VTLAPGRHDSLPSEGVIFTYNPRTALTITGTVSHEQRSTNEEEFVYTDTRASIAAVFKF